MKQSIENTYQKVTQIEHVLIRPDTYIGSIQMIEETLWMLDESQEHFQLKKIKHIPGLYKIFDEILVNAADNYQKDHRMTKIDVKINEKTNVVSVLNDGKSIPVQIHKKYEIYVAELIFGHLLTSSNYEDKVKKITGGRNGYGAKLANIFSKTFSVETADASNRKLLKIEWRNNMNEKSQPVISSYQGKDYTKITFVPDFNKFGIKGFTMDILNLFKKRVYDMAGILKCSVYLNGKRIELHSFEEYARMYMKNPENQEIIADPNENSTRWQVLLTRSQGQFQQISFVNSIATTNGGTHVNKICDQIVENLTPHLTKKVKDIAIKPFQIKSHFRIFINCLVENPSFNSQSKDCLTLNESKFGSSYTISDKFVKALLKSTIPDRILSQLRSKENNKIDKQLKKIKKSSLRLVIPKLEDANLAGKSSGCTLILTEGDSAKALAMSGIETLGRDYFGVFPLRGKVLNVNGLTFKQVMQHYELSNIVKILGLSFGTKYTGTHQLRYSSVMIMADQDIDGSHIKGLILNFFHTFWPSLCQKKGFLKQFVTPIIRCRRGNQRIDFFSQGDYELWRVNGTTDWKIKYYKGLGTSTSAEGKQFFSNLNKHEISFLYLEDRDKQKFDLAFAKKNADNRKKWLEQFDRSQNVDYNQKQLKVEDFFDKEFRHFSISDNIRSIPSLMDGLKPSQRKILFACFKRNLRSQIKVAQLAGYVAEHSAYHHGQVSLCATIVSMAQNYIGSNNLNLLEPIGQFGTRHMNGKDHASPRYIFTCLNSLTRYIFHEADDHIVEYNEEEGMMIEPKYYYPILPLVLINGCEGIGTGWSTNIHPHKVEDVVTLIRQRIKGNAKFVTVGWQNFSGQIQLEKPGIFLVSGSYTIDGDSVTINEIPVGKSIRQYKNFLEQKVRSLENTQPELQSIHEYHSGDKVEFVVQFVEGRQPDAYQMAKSLKLESRLQQTNMTLFDTENRIKKFQTVADIVEQFYHARLKAYNLRRKYLISKFQREAEIMQAKISFINAVMMGKYKLMTNRESWCRQLAINKYKKFNQLTKICSTKRMEVQQNEDSNKQYNYLLSMPIWSFCQEKVVELEMGLAEANKGIKYFSQISEEALWLKDLEEFEEAWNNYSSGKQIKNKDTRQRLENQHGRRSRKNGELNNSIPKDEFDTQGKVKKTKRGEKKVNKSTKNTEKNLIELQLEKEGQELLEFKSGTKKVKTDDWYRYDPVKPKQKQKQSTEEDRISSLLSKYLPNADLAQRIRNRLSNGSVQSKDPQQKAPQEKPAIIDQQSLRIQEQNDDILD